MVKRNVNAGSNEPEEKRYDIPSEKEHLFQVVDILENIDSNPDIVHVKLEVCGGDEQGRTILQRLSLDSSFKGFFATRIFLKAIGEQYKGEIEIDTDHWAGRQFFATVVHNGKYANIKEYNFTKLVEQQTEKAWAEEPKKSTEEEVAWDENL